MEHKKKTKTLCKHCKQRVSASVQKAQCLRMQSEAIINVDIQMYMPRCEKCTTFILGMHRLGISNFSGLADEVIRLELIQDHSQQATELKRHLSAFGHGVYRSCCFAEITDIYSTYLAVEKLNLEVPSAINP